MLQLQDSVSMLPADSVGEGAVADSLGLSAPGPLYGLLLERPADPEVRPVGIRDHGISWLLAAMFLLFVVVCLRYRKNHRFLSLMVHDVTEVRERHNAFDDTVRETAFLWLLNLLWCGAAGILLYGLLFHPEGEMEFREVEVARLAVCIGMAGAYTLFLSAAYAVVGALFSGGAKASMWVRGYLSTQGLESLLLFPVAIVGLCVPGILGAMVLAGAVIFILAKLLFIYKGFCIFFSRIASWVLFLYYLCSLEIVPIVLTYVSTQYLCSLV